MQSTHEKYLLKTQHVAPIAKGGFLKLSKGNISVGIKQIQLEQGGCSCMWYCVIIFTEPDLQDTAKTFFDARRHVSQIDLNRAGTGLMEIVSQPDMR